MDRIKLRHLHLEYQSLREELNEAISKCLESQRWILGPEVEKFEGELAHYLDVAHAVGCSSGTEALLVGLRALALQRWNKEWLSPDQLILTTPFTFVATGDVILRAGATPLFVDIDPQTLQLDIDQALRCLETYPNIVGILPVHLYGISCPLDRLVPVCQQKGLFVLEDCAQAIGARFEGRPLGTLGQGGAFSFFPSKNLGAYGDGGAFVTPDPELAEIARKLIRHGGKDKYNVEHIGYNARLDTLQAAILSVKLKRLDEWNHQRRQLAESYTLGLREITGLALPEVPQGCEPVYHQFTLQTSSRDDLKQHLHENGIDSMVYYPIPLHQMAVFENTRSQIFENSLPHAEACARKVLSLPMDPFYDAAIAQHVSRSIEEFFLART